MTSFGFSEAQLQDLSFQLLKTQHIERNCMQTGGQEQIIHAMEMTLSERNRTHSNMRQIT